MKTVIEMAEACGIPEFQNNESQADNIMRFAELVRADERNRLADKLQQDFKQSFGADTCASWASWIRGQK